MSLSTPLRDEYLAALRWQIHAGADEAIAEKPVNHYHAGLAKSQSAGAPPKRPASPGPAAEKEAAPPRAAGPETPPARRGAAMPSSSEQAIHDARALAHKAKSLAELKAAMESFEGCSLKKTATHTVFGDGNPEASLMLVGEAPGADEDRQGKPFVGVSGQLLTRMLSSIGLTREEVFISNVLPWRPPGNRAPTPAEVSICLPFIERQIELVEPDLLVFVGGVAAKTLLGRNEGIMKLRHQWFDYSSAGLPSPIAAHALFHPAYLLRSPAQKKAAWFDLLEIRKKLDGVVHPR